MTLFAEGFAIGVACGVGATLTLLVAILFLLPAAGLDGPRDYAGGGGEVRSGL